MEDEKEKSDLDQYGVWVKTPPHSLQEETEDAQVKEVSGTSETEPEIGVSPDSFTPDAFTESTVPEDMFISSNDAPPPADSTDMAAPSTDEAPSFEDGEISLDEFLDSGDSSSGEISIDSFLDSGDGGDKNFQPDGEISLDDFLDSSSFGGAEQETVTEEYDEPLDIDLTFDDVDVTLDDGADDDVEISDATTGESLDLDSFIGGSESSGDETLDNFDAMFDNIEDSAPKAPEAKSPAPDTESESIDLSEFGIEDDGGPSLTTSESDDEKPVAQTQDYDLDVGDDGFNESPDSLANEAENDDIALEVETKVDGNKSLKPDEKNPYSAPDEDFDVDSLLNSIEDETSPSGTESQASDVPVPESAANINLEESLTPKESDDLVSPASFPIEDSPGEETVLDDVNPESEVESTSDDSFLEKNDEDFADTQNQELTETVESGDNIISDTESVSDSDVTDSDEAVDLYSFMGDEGFSDPSVAEGNRSYSPEELEEQQKEAERKNQDSEVPASEEVNSEEAQEDQTENISEENVNQVSDGNIEDQTEAGENMEENFVDKEVPEKNQDDELFVDAAEGGVNNEVLEDDDVVPSPFYSPLVENEGEKQIDFSSDETAEEKNGNSVDDGNEGDAGFIVDADSIVQADMNDFAYDEDSGMSVKSDSTDAESETFETQETASSTEDEGTAESDLESKQNSAIPDAGEENMDINTNTSSESPDTAKLMNEIAKELSVLRQEINELKNEFAEFKRNGVVAPSTESAPAEKEENGFFGDMDDDDTIALSGDELSNILSTADFTEEAADGETAVEAAAESESDAASEETVSETDSGSDENASRSIFGSVEDTPAIPDQVNSYENNLQVDFADENLQEPDLNDVNIDVSDSIDDGETSESDEESTLPGEIDVPKSDEDDILVESSNSDFIENEESEPETSDFEAPAAETITEPQESDSASFDEPQIEEDVNTSESFVSENDNMNVEEDNSISQDEADYLSKDAPVAEEDEKLETGISEEPVNQVFNKWENASPEDETLEEPTIEEPAEEESFEAPAPAVEDKVDDDEFKEPVFAETEPESEPETTVNIEPEEENPAPASGVNAIPEDMKEEIKSVLAYMDQLLESLPENKIEEFAKSEQFNTYKKLFNELGLS